MKLLQAPTPAGPGMTRVRLTRPPSLREWAQNVEPARWRDQPVSGLALSYAQAAAAVLRSMTEAEVAAPGSGGKLLPPYLFLWRHHIELALKSVLKTLCEDPVAWTAATGCTLPAGMAGAAVRGHSLERLWNLASLPITAVWSRATHLWRLPEMTPAEADDLIRQLHRIDPNGQGARYDRDTDRSPTMLGVSLVDLEWTDGNLYGIAVFLAWAGAEIGAVMGVRPSEAEAAAHRQAAMEAGAEED